MRCVAGLRCNIARVCIRYLKDAFYSVSKPFCWKRVLLLCRGVAPWGVVEVLLYLAGEVYLLCCRGTQVKLSLADPRAASASAGASESSTLTDVHASQVALRFRAICTLCTTIGFSSSRSRDGRHKACDSVPKTGVTPSLSKNRRKARNPCGASRCATWGTVKIDAHRPSGVGVQSWTCCVRGKRVARRPRGRRLLFCAAEKNTGIHLKAKTTYLLHTPRHTTASRAPAGLRIVRHDAPAGDLEHHPVDLDAPRAEERGRVRGDRGEAARREREDRRARAREADAEQPRVACGRELRGHFGQAGDLRAC